MDDFIPVNIPVLDGKEKEYLCECIDSGWISSEGPFVKKFESAMSAEVNRKFGIAVANGTAALDIAIKALNLKDGDEVIMPSFTIISCAQAIIKNGATPVLVDSDIDTWNMNVEQIAKKITPKTKAIMIVHIYGLPVDIDSILKLADKYNLKIIEDAAEAIGQTYNDKPCGSFGDISIFSFYPNKHITTGEGGMLVTNNAKLADKCCELRNLCFQAKERFVHDDLGWNYRMTNMQAALGVAQLENLDKHIKRKKEIGELYQKELKDCNDIQLPLANTNYANNVYWVFGIILNNGMTAKELSAELANKKIGTRPFFYPMHKQPIFNKMNLFLNEKYPNSEKMAKYGLYLPSGLAISNEEIKYVAKTFKDILNEKSV